MKFSFRLPDGTFVDPNSPLVYTASLADGSALPDWLYFAADTASFAGVPPPGFLGTLAIRVTASDGATSVSDVFDLNVRAEDQPTVLVLRTPDQHIAEDQAWSFTLPAGTFADPDSIGIVYRAGLSGGSGDRKSGSMPLPAWLHFDPLTQTFTGTPPKDFNGRLDLVVTADDGNKVAVDRFALTIAPREDAPVLLHPLEDRASAEDMPLAFTLPADAFGDPDGAVALAWSATRVDGSALPAWLHFDPATHGFSGTPPQDYDGSLRIRVSVSDGERATSDVFTLAITPVDDPPVLARPLANVQVAAGTAFVHALPAGSFTDVDGPALGYSATREDGSPLPDWLHFDAATQRFSGTPPADFAGPVAVRVVASDGLSSVSDVFTFSAGAPFLANPIPDQTVGEVPVWTYVVPRNSFADFDTTRLTYTATQADGSPLPDWLGFDPRTRTFSGAPPEGWSGHEDLMVTATDGTASASDVFTLDQNGDFRYRISGSVWGLSAPAALNYRFNSLFFQSSGSWSTGFDASFDDSPFRGGVSGGIGFFYALQAGLLIDFALKPDTFALQESFDVTHAAVHPVLGGSTYVQILGEIEQGNTKFKLHTPADAFSMHLFAGVTATVGATLSGGISATLVTPDGLPNLDFGAGFDETITLPVIDKVSVADGKITQPSGAIGAIDLTVKTGDPLVQINLDKDGIGRIGIGPPSNIRTDGFDLSADPADGLGTLHGGGTSDPFVTASLDLDRMAIKGILDATGVDLTQLFHTDLLYQLGGFYIGAKLNTDFALVGDLSLREDVYFTPHLYYTGTTSFGQAISGEAGTLSKTVTPEGEGSFATTLTYHSEADLTTVISLHGSIHFDITLLKALLTSGVDISTPDGLPNLSFSFFDIKLPALYDTSLSIVGIDIPIYSNTDHYVLDQSRTETFSVPYERFRTTFGSGDSFALTSHQPTADGNDNPNHLTGNGLDNTLAGYGGDDTLEGVAGANSLDGGDGADVLLGAAGDDSIAGGDGGDSLNGGDGANLLDGGAGDDTITSGSGDDSITGGDGGDSLNGGDGANMIDAGAGDDTIATGSGDDTITDLSGAVHITDTGGTNLITLGDEGYRLTLTAGSYTINTGTGNDRLTTGAGDDHIFAGEGRNVIALGNGDNSARAGAGADSITAGTGNDVVKSGDGNDSIDAGAGNNFIQAGGGNDVVRTGRGADFIDADTGNDSIDAGAGANTVYAGDGNDTIVAGSGADYIDGGTGRDSISGGGGADALIGGEGADTIVGGAGDDTLLGEASGALGLPWTAGSHADVFVFAPGSGHDVISDFNADYAVSRNRLDQDVIDLSAFAAILSTADIAVGVDAAGRYALVLDAADSIALDGFLPGDLTPKALLRQIAFVFHDPGLA